MQRAVCAVLLVATCGGITFREEPVDVDSSKSHSLLEFPDLHHTHPFATGAAETIVNSVGTILASIAERYGKTHKLHHIARMSRAELKKNFHGKHSISFLETDEGGKVRAGHFAADLLHHATRRASSNLGGGAGGEVCTKPLGMPADNEKPQPKGKDAGKEGKDDIPPSKKGDIVISSIDNGTPGFVPSVQLRELENHYKNIRVQKLDAKSVISYLAIENQDLVLERVLGDKGDDRAAKKAVHVLRMIGDVPVPDMEKIVALARKGDSGKEVYKALKEQASLFKKKYTNEAVQVQGELKKLREQEVAVQATKNKETEEAEKKDIRKTFQKLMKTELDEIKNQKGDVLKFFNMLKFAVGWSVPVTLAKLLNPSLPALVVNCGPLGACLAAVTKLPKQITTMVWKIVSLPFKCIFMVIKAALVSFGVYDKLSESLSGVKDAALKLVPDFMKVKAKPEPEKTTKEDPPEKAFDLVSESLDATDDTSGELAVDEASAKAAASCGKCSIALIMGLKLALSDVLFGFGISGFFVSLGMGLGNVPQMMGCAGGCLKTVLRTFTMFENLIPDKNKARDVYFGETCNPHTVGMCMMIGRLQECGSKWASLENIVKARLDGAFPGGTADGAKNMAHPLKLLARLKPSMSTMDSAKHSVEKAKSVMGGIMGASKKTLRRRRRLTSAQPLRSSSSTDTDMDMDTLSKVDRILDEEIDRVSLEKTDEKRQLLTHRAQRFATAELAQGAGIMGSMKMPKMLGGKKEVERPSSEAGSSQELEDERKLLRQDLLRESKMDEYVTDPGKEIPGHLQGAQVCELFKSSTPFRVERKKDKHGRVNVECATKCKEGSKACQNFDLKDGCLQTLRTMNTAAKKSECSIAQLLKSQERKYSSEPVNSAPLAFLNRASLRGKGTPRYLAPLLGEPSPLFERCKAIFGCYDPYAGGGDTPEPVYKLTSEKMFATFEEFVNRIHDSGRKETGSELHLSPEEAATLIIDVLGKAKSKSMEGITSAKMKAAQCTHRWKVSPTNTFRNTLWSHTCQASWGAKGVEAAKSGGRSGALKDMTSWSKNFINDEFHPGRLIARMMGISHEQSRATCICKCCFNIQDDITTGCKPTLAGLVPVDNVVWANQTEKENGRGNIRIAAEEQTECTAVICSSAFPAACPTDPGSFQRGQKSVQISEMTADTKMVDTDPPPSPYARGVTNFQFQPFRPSQTCFESAKMVANWFESKDGGLESKGLTRTVKECAEGVKQESENIETCNEALKAMEEQEKEDEQRVEKVKDANGEDDDGVIIVDGVSEDDGGAAG